MKLEVRGKQIIANRMQVDEIKCPKRLGGCGEWIPVEIREVKAKASSCQCPGCKKKWSIWGIK